MSRREYTAFGVRLDFGDGPEEMIVSVETDHDYVRRMIELARDKVPQKFTTGPTTVTIIASRKVTQ
jgi:hypothetical protein